MRKTFWVTFIVAIVMIDQLSKWLTETFLPLQELVDVLPFLGLYRTYNYGVAFSMLSGFGRWPLVLMTVAIMGFVIWLWRSLPDQRYMSELGFALVLGGALGNLIDRIGLGYVVDMIFFHLPQIDFQFAVFNLADTFITLGAFAIIIDEVMVWRQSRSKEKDTSS